VACDAAGRVGGSETTLMMRDELPEEHDPEFKRLGRRISWGAFLLGIVSVMLYLLMRARP